MKLTPEARVELSDSFGKIFSHDRLAATVLVSTGQSLFGELVGPGKPVRDTAFDLLDRLEQTGQTALFLARVFMTEDAEGELSKKIRLYCPEAAEAEPINARVSRLVEGIEQVSSKMNDPAVRSVLMSAREAIAKALTTVNALSAYKNLHDCLHYLQLKEFHELRDAAKTFPSNIAQTIPLTAYENEVKTTYIRAREALDMLGSESTEREMAAEWIDALEDAAEALALSIDAEDSGAVIGALRDIRRVIRTEPLRLNRLIYLTAKALPLNQITVALAQVSDAAGPGDETVAAQLQVLRNLGPDLMGRVEEHKLWQQTDNLLWELEDILEYSPPDVREYFVGPWTSVETKMLSLAALEAKADWSARMVKYCAAVDREVQQAGQLVGGEQSSFVLRLSAAVSRCSSAARIQFFIVDSQLKRSCAELVKIAPPLHAILEGLGNGH